MIEQRLSYKQRLKAISQMMPEQLLETITAIVEDAYNEGFYAAAEKCDTFYIESPEIGELMLKRRLFLKDKGLIP